jgi:alkylation response protein AidB-like acyl-CoA dehydrogenase
MNLELSETQRLLRDTVRDYLEREVPFARVRQVEKARGWDEALWKDLCAHGWLATPFPEALGGGGGSLVDAGIVVEELARRAVIVPVLEQLASAWALARRGEGQARGAVERALRGEITLAPALLEASDRFERVECRADREGRMFGEKRFVDYASAATHHLMSARGDGGLGLYLVEAAGSGVRTSALQTIGRTPTAGVHYDGARGVRVGGAEAVAELVRIGRALAALQGLGCMQQALDMTVEYAGIRVQFGRPIGAFQAVHHHCANMATVVEASRFLVYEALDMTVEYAGIRVQFGRPIGAFQAVHHHCANMATVVEASRFLVYEALDSLERGDATDEQIALAKASVSRAVPEVTMLAQQIHGGNGFIEENDLYFFTIRGKERSLAWGTAEECLAIVAKSIEEPEAWL